MAGIALIADVHGNSEALRAVIEDLERKDPEEIYFLGDVCGFGPDPGECIDLLRDLGVKHLKGNHDIYVLLGERGPVKGDPYGTDDIHREILGEPEREFLEKGRLKILTEIYGIRCELVHANNFDYVKTYLFPEGPDERIKKCAEKAKEEEISCLIFGHSHIPAYFKKYGISFLNPGSVGQPRDGIPRASYAMIYEGFEVKFYRVKYDVEKVIKRMLELGYPKYHAERLRYGW